MPMVNSILLMCIIFWFMWRILQSVDYHCHFRCNFHVHFHLLIRFKYSSSYYFSASSSSPSSADKKLLESNNEPKIRNFSQPNGNVDLHTMTDRGVASSSPTTPRGSRRQKILYTTPRSRRTTRSVLPYMTSFRFMLSVVFEDGGTCVGLGVVAAISKEQSVPSQPVSQKHLFVLVQTCSPNKSFIGHGLITAWDEMRLWSGRLP